MHGFLTDDWEEWFTANQIEFVPEPSNSSTTTSALDLAPFGEEQKLTNKINNAVSILYANDNYQLRSEHRNVGAGSFPHRHPKRISPSWWCVSSKNNVFLRHYP
jgi:hypothetical protein